MKRLKGPELKMPELKVPTFLADLYYDLRDRRLLPLVALVVVAIAAVPFLLGGDAEEVPVTAAGAGAADALESEGSTTAELTVVEATPGLRDYRKRLRSRAPADPFRQRFTEPAGAASSSSAGGAVAPGSSSSPSAAPSEGSATTESSTPTTEVESGGGSSGGPSHDGGSSGGNGAGAGKPNLVLFDYAIDARISRSEDSADSAPPQEPVVKHRILPQTPLPGEKAPVVTYMGPGRKDGNKATGKVLLLVSGDVQSISGEYRCVSGSGDSCQMLEVEPGFPLTFAYGDNDVHYTIKVLKIELVVTGHT